MPLHVYNCKCGHSFERLESIHEEKPKRCPECGHKASIGVGRTGTPILREGKGGFYRPTRAEPIPQE